MAGGAAVSLLDHHQAPQKIQGVGKYRSQKSQRLQVLKGLQIIFFLTAQSSSRTVSSVWEKKCLLKIVIILLNCMAEQQTNLKTQVPASILRNLMHYSEFLDQILKIKSSKPTEFLITNAEQVIWGKVVRLLCNSNFNSVK